MSCWWVGCCKVGQSFTVGGKVVEDGAGGVESLKSQGSVGGGYDGGLVDLEKREDFLN